MRTFTVGARAGFAVVVLVVSFCLLVAGAGRADAGPRWWNNPAGGNWSDANNWLPVAPPADGDDLIFPPNAANVDTTCDLPAVTVGSLTFNGSYTVNGTTLNLAGGLTTASSLTLVNLNATVVLTADQTWTISSNNSLMTSATVTLSNAAWTVDGGGIVVVRQIGGTGSLTKNGGSDLTVIEASTFQGPVTVNAGNVAANHPDAFGYSDGTPGHGTTINSPGKIRFNVGVGAHVPEAFFLNGNGNVVITDRLGGGWPITFDGPITLLTTSGFSGNGPASGAYFSQSIAGPGGLIVSAPLNVWLAGSTAGTFPTVSFTGTGAATLTLEADGVLPAGVSIDLPADAQFLLNGHDAQVGMLTGTGTVVADGTLTINASANHAFNGTIGGNGRLRKTGPAEWAIGGDNTFALDTVVSAGTLRITNANALSPGGTDPAKGTTVLGNATLVFDNIAPNQELVTLTRVAPTDTPTLKVLGPTPMVMASQVTMNAGARLTGDGGGDISFAVTLKTSGGVTFDHVIARLAFAANDLAGVHTVGAGGVLDVAVNNGFGDQKSLALDGGTFALNGRTVRVNALNGTSGNVALGTNGTLDVAAPSGSPSTYSGNVTGSGTLKKSAAGDFTLAGATSFTGQVTVTGGRLILAHSQAVTSQALTVNMFATLMASAPLNFTGAVSLTGFGPNNASQALLVQGGDVTFSGPTTVGSAGMSVFLNASRTVTFQTAVTGGTFFAADGPGTVVFNAAGNSFDDMWIGKVPVDTATTLRLGASNALPTSTVIHFGGTATFDVNGVTQQIRAIEGANTIAIGSGALTLGLPGEDGMAIFARLTGTGSLTMNGKYVYIVNSLTHPFSGAITVNGSLEIDYAKLPSASVTVNSTASDSTLKLLPPVALGPLTVNGTKTFTVGMAQGSGPVTLGGLTISSAATTLKLYMHGTTAPLKVNGPVSIAGTLDYQLSDATFTAGQSLVLIDNDGTDPIAGTFASLAEGAGVTTVFGDLVVSYAGGSGNDFSMFQASTTYQLAEGATGSFFDTDLLIANPANASVDVDVTLLPEAGAAKTIRYTLAPKSRLTVRVDGIEGFENTAFSTLVKPTGPQELVVERTMRWDASEYGAHTEKAVEEPEEHWYFAEGSQGYFQTFLLLANPNDVANQARVRYVREGGAVIERTVDLAPRSRRTVFAGDDPELVNQSFGMIVDFTLPGVAERSMYFGGHPLWTGGHESIGATGLSNDWFFAEGATGFGFETFILVTNVGFEPNEVTLTFFPESGQTATLTRTIPGFSRLTINPAAENLSLPPGPVATQIRAQWALIAERSQYWSIGAPEWIEAHNSFGVKQPAQKWGLAEGRAGGPQEYQTYILIANTYTTDATVTLEFLGDGVSPAPPAKTVLVPAQTRLNVLVEPTTPDGSAATTFGTIISSETPIVVERSMYWNANGQVWAAGTNATATKLK